MSIHQAGKNVNKGRIKLVLIFLYGLLKGRNIQLNGLGYRYIEQLTEMPQNVLYDAIGIYSTVVLSSEFFSSMFSFT